MLNTNDAAVHPSESGTIPKFVSIEPMTSSAIALKGKRVKPTFAAEAIPSISRTAYLVFGLIPTTLQME